MLDIMERPLTGLEIKQKKGLEEIIDQNLQAFFAVGRALMEIRDKKLYREDYRTFEAYCRARFDIGKNRANQYVGGATVLVNLTTMVVKNEAESCQADGPIIDLLPINERQVRPLTRLEPEEQRKVWSAAVFVAQEREKPVTGAIVKRVAADYRNDKAVKVIQHTQKDTVVKEFASEDFSAAFRAFVEQIDRARAEGWIKTSRLAILRHLDGLRDIVAEDGPCPLDDPGYAFSGDEREKLLRAGYTFLRRNPQNLTIEKLDSTGPGWQHYNDHATAESRDEAFTHLMKDEKFLRG